MLSHGVVPSLSIFINSGLSDDVDHDLSGRPGQSDGPYDSIDPEPSIVWILACLMVYTQPATCAKSGTGQIKRSWGGGGQQEPSVPVMPCVRMSLWEVA